MSFVLDASITVRWALSDDQQERLEKAAHVLSLLKNEQAFVPCLWYLEVTNVLVRAQAKAAITELRLETFLGFLNQLPIKHDECIAEHRFASVSTTARMHRLSAYDSAYFDLAIRKNIPIATFDEALIKAAKEAGISILLR